MVWGMDQDVFIVLLTFPEGEHAATIATALVERQLAACVNLLPGATSIYRWQGAVQRESEVVGIAKTTRARLPALKQALAALHPYECPELLAFPATDGLPAYLAWLAEN
jgi:periplasmic divalent cation tolerance protein